MQSETALLLLSLQFAISVAVLIMLTGYGLDGPGIEPRWGRDFSHTSRPALGPTQPPVQWLQGLSRGVKRSGCGADHPPLPVPRSRKIRTTPLPPSGPSGLLGIPLPLPYYNVGILFTGRVQWLGPFVKLRKVTIIFVTFVCPSVRLCLLASSPARRK
jgi:hypothetical protein